MSWVSKRLLSRVDNAIQGTDSAAAGLEAVFLTHIDFIAEHPGVPRMLFGELQRQEQTLPKKNGENFITALQRAHTQIT